MYDDLLQDIPQQEVNQLHNTENHRVILSYYKYLNVPFFLSFWIFGFGHFLHLHINNLKYLNFN